MSLLTESQTGKKKKRFLLFKWKSDEEKGLINENKNHTWGIA